MATRPAYFIKNGQVVSNDYDFQWFSGFAVSQKQKSIAALHAAIQSADSTARPLEISTKSPDMLGVKLSAFNLRLNGYTLENIFQSAKMFENGGPFSDLLTVHPKDAKQDERLKTSGALIGFHYDGHSFPLEPKTVFYDYIYIQAVRQSLTDDEIHSILAYNYFTDIEYNPKKSINTQAKTVAEIKLMTELFGVLPELDIETFIRFHQTYITA